MGGSGPPRPDAVDVFRPIVGVWFPHRPGHRRPWRLDRGVRPDPFADVADRPHLDHVRIAVQIEDLVAVVDRRLHRGDSAEAPVRALLGPPNLPAGDGELIRVAKRRADPRDSDLVVAPVRIQFDCRLPGQFGGPSLDAG